MATFTVIGGFPGAPTSDPDSIFRTLEEAVDAANELDGLDTIRIESQSIFPDFLSISVENEIKITDDVIIEGKRDDFSQNSIISGVNDSDLFNVEGGVDLTLSNLSLRNSEDAIQLQDSSNLVLEGVDFSNTTDAIIARDNNSILSDGSVAGNLVIEDGNEVFIEGDLDGDLVLDDENFISILGSVEDDVKRKGSLSNFNSIVINGDVGDDFTVDDNNQVTVLGDVGSHFIAGDNNDIIRVDGDIGGNFTVGSNNGGLTGEIGGHVAKDFKVGSGNLFEVGANIADSNAYIIKNDLILNDNNEITVLGSIKDDIKRQANSSDANQVKVEGHVGGNVILDNENNITVEDEIVGNFRVKDLNALDIGQVNGELSVEDGNNVLVNGDLQKDLVLDDDNFISILGSVKDDVRRKGDLSNNNSIVINGDVGHNFTVDDNNLVTVLGNVGNDFRAGDNNDTIRVEGDIGGNFTVGSNNGGLTGKIGGHVAKDFKVDSSNFFEVGANIDDPNAFVIEDDLILNDNNEITVFGSIKEDIKRQANSSDTNLITVQGSVHGDVIADTANIITVEDEILGNFKVDDFNILDLGNVNGDLRAIDDNIILVEGDIGDDLIVDDRNFITILGSIAEDIKRFGRVSEGNFIAVDGGIGGENKLGGDNIVILPPSMP